jgi:hypothetical protein
MRIRFLNRDFTEKIIQPALDFTIQRYSWDVKGGPAQAAVTATGERGALFELVNHMREPVEILTDKGDCVWWGFLATLEISWDAVQFGVDIGTMFNNVAVAYTNGPLRYTTQWSGDADSIAEYGYKEMLLSHSDCTEADALSERDVYLAGAKHPIPTLRFGSGGGQASLTLKGWYGTLEWQYYANESGFEGYDVSNQGGREVGEDDRPSLAMSFQIGAAAGWTATTLWLHAWWQGTSQPSDNLTVSICSDNGGIPGTVLATGQIAGADLTGSATWVEFTLSTGVALSTATTYWIVVSRSGSVDPDAYYMLDTNLNRGYTRGELSLYHTSSSSWVSEPWKGDLLFKLQGTLSTTAQIQTLVASAGQFFTGSIIENASGVETVPYRSGDSTAMYELEKLLGIGTTNNRRLLPEATRNFYLRVYEEPAKPAAVNGSYGLGPDGSLYFPGTRNPVRPELCPVGIWAALVDVIPPTVDFSLIADPNRFFIEAAEFDVSAGEYRIQRTKDQSNEYEIGGAEQG